MTEHETGIISNGHGKHWLVCTCGYDVLLASRPKAEEWAAKHRELGWCWI